MHIARVRHRPLAAGALLALVLAVAACGSSSSPSASPTTVAASPTTGATATTTTGASTSPSAGTKAKETPADQGVGHVFVINLENKDFSETWGPTSVATYLNGTLKPQGQLLSNYYGIAHVSLPNYIAEISGQSPNPSTAGDCPIYTDFASTGTGADGQALGKGCVYPTNVKTVADQLTAAKFTWKAYQEDIENGGSAAKTCRHPEINKGDDTLIARAGDQYATRHDPFVYFHSVTDTPACNTDVVSLGQLDTDMASAATTPNLSFITPNLCDDGHDAPCVDGKPGGLLSADAWLKTWVPKITASAAFKKDGLLVITFDEAEAGTTVGSTAQPDASACCHTPTSPNVDQAGLTGPGGGKVGTLLISPLIKPGTTNPTPYNHYALLCSIENAFGLSHLGFAGAPGLTCFGKDVYDAAKPTS